MKIVFTLLLVIFSLSSVKIYSQIKSVNINALVSMMEGSFSSEEQSANDPEYPDLRLHIKKIWQDRTDGKWLYVEQASAETPDKPYRQRVYRITSTREGRFESAVFTLRKPLRFAGEWMNENPIPGLTPDSLHLREGCSVIITLMNDTTFEGSTVGSDCKSKMRGAKYATSEVQISPSIIKIRDRGFDEDGIQVWGAEKGGYIFKRTK